jgi:membrane-bound inhibitor of C-type lysozyme
MSRPIASPRWLVVGGVVIICLGSFILSRAVPRLEYASSPNLAPLKRPQVKVTYLCKKNLRMTARFDNYRRVVAIKLPDGSDVFLRRAASASGARFTNGDQVFWEHRGTGTYYVKDQMICTGIALAAD